MIVVVIVMVIVIVIVFGDGEWDRCWDWDWNYGSITTIAVQLLRPLLYHYNSMMIEEEV